MNRTQFAEPAPKVATAPLAQRRGACPSLAAPMRTGDGLLARLRPVGRTMRPEQLERVAVLAAKFGNGQIEITARGNLQVRGLRAETADLFAGAVEDAVEIENGLPVDISPLAGMDATEVADPRPVAEAIANGARESGLARRLGPKVCVLVDGGGLAALRDFAADVHLTAITAHGGGHWMLKAGSNSIGPLETADAAGAVLHVLEMTAELGLDGRARNLDMAGVRATLALLPPDGAIDGSARTFQLVRLHPLKSGGIGVGIAVAFGSTDWAPLVELSRAAHQSGIAQFRLAPRHGLIAIAATPGMAEAFRQSAAALGFIVDGGDARTAISACVGSVGCASGTLPARAMAARLAVLQPDFFDGSFDLHVSGCAKGCAHPRKALLTLVGDGESCHLILNGMAGNPPLAQFAQAEIETVTERLVALWRDNRALGESVAACFKRLDEAAIVAAVRQG